MSSRSVSSRSTGRHRAPNTVSSASSLSSAISGTAMPASKASAVIVMSGAMVASLALPASAATPTIKVKTSAPAALRVAVAAPSSAQAPLVPRTFGEIGFSGVDKSKTITVRITADRASRSATRIALPQPMSATRSSGILGIAASLAGIYYVYGGTTTAGFDCSGYTQYVFAKMGISLPRTAEQQRQATTPVTNPQPGDLVFFGFPAHHVGIYAGNGTMWDSQETGTPIALRTDRSERNGGATYGRV